MPLAMVTAPVYVLAPPVVPQLARQTTLGRVPSAAAQSMAPWTVANGVTLPSSAAAASLPPSAAGATSTHGQSSSTVPSQSPSTPSQAESSASGVPGVQVPGTPALQAGPVVTQAPTPQPTVPRSS